MKVTIAHLIFASLTLAPVSAIIGGGEVSKDTKKYVTGVRYNDDSDSPDDFSYCGAALISSTRVLTTASCALYRANDVAVGAHLYSGDHDGDEIEVASVIPHPNYNSKTLSHNFAILKLKRKTDRKPVQLPNEDGSDIQTGELATAFGWGNTSTSSTATHSDVLLSVSQQIITNDECRKARGSTTIDDSHVCAIGKQGKAPCKGDGGGPLIKENGNGDVDDVLIGLISNSNSCGINGTPTIYSRVSSVVGWIKKNL